MTPEERIARLEAQVEHQGESLALLRHEIEGLRLSIDRLVSQAQRWKGGFGVILGLGGVFGTLATLIAQWLMRKVGG